MIFKFLGILSALVFLAGDIPYLHDAIKGKIKPHRVTWGIVTLLNGIGFANQLASGADNSLWIFGVATILTGAIFIASLWRGVGGHSKQDIFALIMSLAGIGLWFVFDSPLLSILANIFVGTVCLMPTIIKAKKHPESETRIAWLCGSTSTLLAAISVGSLDWQLLLLPVAATIQQGYMVYILYFEARPKKPTKPVDLEEAKRNIL